ncbi:MAG TPA: response regulator [Candidatus Baltobacteraceae bacterium]|nr:response regulator [Candidatus Baltobacteraceae bacterium]
MIEQATHVKVHVIEPQELFVSSLTQVFRDLGLGVDRFSGEANFRQLLEDPPDLIFIDVDFSSQEPLKFITLLRTLLPKALIAVYTSMRSADWAKACHFSGANAVLTKAADHDEIVAGLRQMIDTGEFTDVRLRSSLAE